MKKTRRLPEIAGTLIDAAAAAFVGAVGQRLERGRLPPAGHRPWPLPDEPWVMAQRWEHLLFAHWRVPADAVAALLPPGLPLDTFEASAWISISPFRVTGVRLRGLSAVPRLSDFHEINVRTYVRLDGKPGVWFFSLDADSTLGVMSARAWYRLPYFLAAAHLEPRGDGFRFTSNRRHPGAPAATFSVDYRPARRVERAATGSPAWWLTERYCLYARDSRGALHRAEIHHEPWPLHPVEVEVRENTMAAPLGLRLDSPPALVNYARSLDVSVWRPHPCCAPPVPPAQGASRDGCRPHEP
jgi:uncharacterized protein YqjF (DUF2071 family)